MKKFLFVLVLLVAVGLTLVATCPDRAAHHEALKSVASAVINSEMNDNYNLDSSVASIGTMLAINVVDSYLQANLVVRDKTFYNVGFVSYEGELRMISVGVFNHVFTVDEGTAREIIKGKIKLPEL